MDTTLGERIRAAREKHELTQEQLGRMVGLSKDKVNKIENGTRGVAGDELWAIAEAISVNYAHLLRGPVTVAFRGEGDAERIAEGLAIFDRFTDNWHQAWVLEKTFGEQ